MNVDRILFLLAAICWFIGGLVSFFGGTPNTSSTAPTVGRVNWWLLGAGFVALTFVF